MRLALAAALVLGGCVMDDDDDASTPTPEGDISWSDEVACDTPVDGWVRLQEEGGAPFATAPTISGGPCASIHGQVAVADVDDDGDPDLAVGQSHAPPLLYRNDGGDFTEVALPAWNPGDRQFFGISFVDLDADRLPELVIVGEGFVAVATNLGELRFDAFRTPLLQDYPRGCFYAATAGDVDGDGDLDLFVPGSDRLDDPTSEYTIDPDAPADDHLFSNADGRLTPVDGIDGNRDRIALFGHFTDFDGDADPDLLVAPDRMHVLGGGTIDLFENQGRLVNRSTELGAAAPMLGGMGVAAADLNDDGLLDYCLTDAVPVMTCLLSGPFGFVEAGLNLGLIVDDEPFPEWPGEFWNGWSVEFADLDADGRLDVVAAASHPDRAGVEPDMLWRGAPGGFEQAGVEQGFASLDEHSGLGMGDFSGDGYPDIVVGAREGRPQLWTNPCGANAWIDVELRGPPGNPRGIGARVETRLAGRTDVREVSAGRAWGQSDARVHVGAANLTEVALTVTWPDGRVDEATVPTRRRVVVTHPAAL